ncbi:hypothetical protein JHK87_054537 [Glycine soja]|nr:hypothetical protein JHK87_054537 [Glycine soja]
MATASTHIKESKYWSGRAESFGWSMLKSNLIFRHSSLVNVAIFASTVMNILSFIVLAVQKNKITLDDTETYESLFKEYWEIIKVKEGLTSGDILAALPNYKKGK